MDDQELPSALVAVEWERRTRSEYASAAYAQQIGYWLTELGASPDLIEDALRIAAEELDLAARCYGVHLAAGGSQTPTIDRAVLRLDQTDDLHSDLLRHVLQLFCLGETLAVSMFNEARLAASVPIARETLEIIVRDEVGHRQFGWEVLDWLIENGSIPDAPATIANLAVPMIAEFASLFSAVGGADSVGPAERAWGLTPLTVATRLVDRCVGTEWPRRFGARGIEITGAASG